MHFDLLALGMLMFVDVICQFMLLFNLILKVMLCGGTDACIVPIVVAGFARLKYNISNELRIIFL